jgi:hypothetical protein
MEGMQGIHSLRFARHVASGGLYSLSWLLEASFQVYDEVKCEFPDSLITRHFFCTEDNSRGDIHAGAGIGDIIYQLIIANPRTIATPNRFQLLRERTESEIWSHPDPREPWTLLYNLLADKEMQQYPAVYVFLDRVDLCQCSAVQFVDDIISVMQQRQSSLALKVFIVMGDRQDTTKGSLATSNLDGRIHVVTKNQKFLLERH